MALIRESSREVQFKLVFSGAALSGKTSNLVQAHRLLDKSLRGDLISLNTSSDRTLYFDFLPVNPVLIEGYRTKFLLYTVPGQVVYNATRELVLRGADGIIFVVDSDPARWDDNLVALQNLEHTLEASGRDAHRLPLVIQYNKRDLAGAVPIAELEEAFNPAGRPSVEAASSTGYGVLEGLDLLSTEVLRRFHAERASTRQPSLSETKTASPW